MRFRVNNVKNVYKRLLELWLTACDHMQQEKTEELQQKNEVLERNVSEVTTENRHLREPLALASTELAEMRTKTDDYDNMKSILQVRALQASSQFENSFVFYFLHS